MFLAPFLTGNTITPRMVACLVLSAAFAAVSICIYQLSFNLILVMLLVPVMACNKHDIVLQRRLLACYIGAVVLVAVYYVLWRISYSSPETNYMDGLYGPDRVGFAQLIKQLKVFPLHRFTQIANLWHVADPYWSPFYYFSAGTVLLVGVVLLLRERWYGLLKLVILAGTIPASDIFRLVSGKNATYTTVHSINAAWWFILVLAVIYLLGRHAGKVLAVLVVVGVGYATVATGHLVLRNHKEYSIIEQNLDHSPTAKHMHIIVMKGNYSERAEYGWTIGQGPGFMAQMVATMVRHKGYATVQIGSTDEQGGLPTYTNPCGRPEYVIRLPSKVHQCDGLGCRLSDAEIDNMTWPAC